MKARERRDSREGALLALLAHEERLARWQSLPAGAREEAVERLARMMLRAGARESGDEARDAGEAAAP